MILTINGYEGSQGSAEELSSEIISRQHVSGDAYINWRRIAVPELFLEQAAHLLFIQGISPVQFFLASTLTIGRGYCSRQKEKIYEGPLLYLAGKLSPTYEVPAKFTKVVLGQLLKTTAEKTNVQETFLALSKYESQRHLVKNS